MARASCSFPALSCSKTAVVCCIRCTACREGSAAAPPAAARCRTSLERHRAAIGPKRPAAALLPPRGLRGSAPRLSPQHLLPQQELGGRMACYVHGVSLRKKWEGALRTSARQGDDVPQRHAAPVSHGLTQLHANRPGCVFSREPPGQASSVCDGRDSQHMRPPEETALSPRYLPCTLQRCCPFAKAGVHMHDQCWSTEMQA